MKDQRRLWVVETQDKKLRRWFPDISSPTREESRGDAQWLRSQGANTRVRCYVPREEGK